MNTCRSILLLILSTCAFSVPAQDSGIENLRETGKAFAAVARQVSPAVVNIQVESARGAVSPEGAPLGEAWPFGEEFFRRFFGEPSPGLPPGESPGGQLPVVSQGSGFVFAAKQDSAPHKSYILTNSHVVAGAETIRVKFSDGRESVAQIKGTDPKSDIAVLEVEASGLPALKWGDSAKLEVGEWVVAMGSPFGLSHTLTVGVVSAKGRTALGISAYEDFIQTDAAINPGNSGGPLLNLNGEVVGVNTAIFTRSGGYMGLGFAIPSNLARNIAEQLIETGEVIRGHLGVVIQPLTRELAQSFGLEQSQGILIAQVTEGAPADKAGLQQGDVIIGYQGKPVNDIGDFRNRVSLTAPGTRERLTILRDGKAREVTVVIGELTQEEASLPEEPLPTSNVLGLAVQTLTPDLAKQFNAKPGQGVVVTLVERESPAARVGITTGDIILEVNRKPVNSVTAFERAVKASEKDKRALLLIRAGTTQRYVVLTWE